MNAAGRPEQRPWDWRWWSTITAFAIAMAMLESICVVYIREIIQIAPGPVELPAAAATEMMARHPWLLPTEQWREATTMVMLAALGVLAGRTRWQQFGVWLYAFGLWDIFYYVWLHVFTRWPPSLMSTDVLFLIPVPWISPVLLPVAIATGMVAVGARLMAREARRLPETLHEREPATV